jgi:CRP-like cAMP-binding protein
MFTTQTSASADDRVSRVRALPLFAALDDSALERIAALSAEIDARPGQVLARADDPGAGMFVVEDGRVLVELRTRSLELGPGEFFGELSLLAPNAMRTARVRAATDARLLAISRADLGDLLEDEPRVAAAMLPVVAQRLVDETLAKA